MRKISLSRALLYISLSVVIIWGSLFVSVWYWKKTLLLRNNDSHSLVSAIVQTKTQQDTLSCSYLAEILNFSQDKPSNIYTLDVASLNKTLNAYPVVAEAFITKMLPDTLHIAYTLKEPIAYLADYDNIVVDAYKHVFPLRPFFSHKRLPKLYTGLTLQKNFLEEPIEDNACALALKVLSFLENMQEPYFRVLHIDTKDVFSESLYRGQMVVSLECAYENNVFQVLIRCTAKKYEEQLNRVFSTGSLLFAKVIEEKASLLIVDARFDEMLLFTTEVTHL